jgi:glutamate decarboxylase
VQKQLASATPEQVQVINEKLDRLVRQVQKAQREAGKSFVSRTRLEVSQYGDVPVTVFRVVLANPLTSNADLDAILAEQQQLASSTKLWQQLTESVV